MLHRMLAAALAVCLAPSLGTYHDATFWVEGAMHCLEIATPERPMVLQILREGMTLPEVIAILGPPRPPTNQNVWVLDLYGGGILMHEGEILEWWFPNWVVQIVFDNNGRSVFVRWLELYQIPEYSCSLL